MKRLIIKAVLLAAASLTVASNTFAQDTQGQPLNGDAQYLSPNQNQNRSGFRELVRREGSPHIYGSHAGTESWFIACLNSNNFGDADPNLPLTAGNRFVVEPVLKPAEKLKEATIAFSLTFGALTPTKTTISVFEADTGHLLLEIEPRFSGVAASFADRNTPVFWGDNTIPFNDWLGIPFAWLLQDGRYSYSRVIHLKLANPGNIRVEVRGRADNGAIQIAAGGFSDKTPRPQ